MKLYSLLLSIFLLTGCTTSSLNLGADETLTLKYGKEKLSARGLTLDSKFDQYPELQLRQSVLELDDDTLLVYEEVTVDLLYQFQYSTPQSIKMIFDAQKSKLIYQRNNLYFFQLLLKNSKYLNVICQQSGLQSLTQLYGFSNKQMEKIIAKISGEGKKLELDENIIMFEHFKRSYLSTWSAKLIAIDGLITVDASLRR
ncbi:MAG: hypothetical protein U9R50_09340 [Campylobacterota bacterium]|nr:hypothetical protein [Campylobacterota bacterium]